MAFPVLYISYLLFLSIHLVTTITFNFKNMSQEHLNRDIYGEGVSFSDGGIQLTSNLSWNGGRVTYIRQLHLWDTRSQELASFSTNFTFVIDSNGNNLYADGLTFFLAQNNSVITQGGAMGLPFYATPNNATSPFVAVEFDTFFNEWDPIIGRGDPIYDHVGIDVSSVSSAISQKWLSNVSGAGVCQAWITYDSVSKNLTVSFTGFQNGAVVRQDGLAYAVDLRRELPEWVIFGFSAATGAMFQKSTVRSWSFESSELAVDRNKEIIPPVPSPNSFSPVPRRVRRKSRKVVVVICATVTIAFVCLLGFVLRWRKKRSKEDEPEIIAFDDVEMNNEFENEIGPKQFTYLELVQSTSDFAESNKLGEGGFGRVYKGFLKDSNTYIAVKRVSKSSKQGIEEYASEVRIISQLRHRNLVQLTGWCHEKGELLLVYVYMENGSLDSHLFKAKSLLTWGARYKIANGLASAIWYLHEGWEQCVLHRDIKSSNVMLDSNFNPKLGDFGLAKLVDHEKSSETTMLAGTVGYMAPECVVTGRATKESDVFSFGVVALEIACGRKAIEYKAQEKQIRLIEWVWELYGTGHLIEAVDPRLGLEFEEEEIKRLMIVGLWCVHPHSEHRPSMRQVIQVLNSEASLPILPTTMPVATHLASRILSLFGVASIIDN